MIVALVFATLASAALPPHEPRLALTPVILQNAVYYTSDRVTAGGAGGGLGLEFAWDRRYLAQADVTMLLTFGNAVASRVAFGAQGSGRWAPAAWGTFNALFGDRIEFLTGDGQRPKIPSWAVGVRGSALRFRSEYGFVSIAEAGVGTDFSGGLWLELTILEAGARF